MSQKENYSDSYMKTYYKIPRTLTVESLHTAFINYFRNGYSSTGEMHDFWEMVYVFDGSATIVKGNKIFALNKGELIFHPPMEFHRILSNNEPFAAMFITFSATGELINKLTENIYTLDIVEHNLLFDLKKEIEETYEVRNYWLYTGGESPLSLHSIALRIELFMINLLKRNIPKKTDKNQISTDFSYITDIFKSNIDKDLAIEELATLTYLGVSNLKRICRKYTGMGPAKYFLHLKIAHATELLKSGMKVTEISEALAFSSQSYFSSVYKRETGKSPKDIKPNA